jgi:antitoxin YefM
MARDVPRAGLRRDPSAPRYLGVESRVQFVRKMAILMAMTAAEHLSLADVKNRLSEVVDRLEREHGRVIITKHGRPAAVVLSIEDLEGLEETLELLADPKVMRRIKKANAELVEGKSATLTKDQALALARGK